LAHGSKLDTKDAALIILHLRVDAIVQSWFDIVPYLILSVYAPEDIAYANTFTASTLSAECAPGQCYYG